MATHTQIESALLEENRKLQLQLAATSAFKQSLLNSKTKRHFSSIISLEGDPQNRVGIDLGPFHLALNLPSFEFPILSWVLFLALVALGIYTRTECFAISFYWLRVFLTGFRAAGQAPDAISVPHLSWTGTSVWYQTFYYFRGRNYTWHQHVVYKSLLVIWVGAIYFFSPTTCEVIGGYVWDGARAYGYVLAATAGIGICRVGRRNILAVARQVLEIAILSVMRVIRVVWFVWLPTMAAFKVFMVMLAVVGLAVYVEGMRRYKLFCSPEEFCEDGGSQAIAGFVYAVGDWFRDFCFVRVCEVENNDGNCWL
ncbi:hypothetical protein QBC35DRAFT_534652 [Podospora australis]|uniref:Uncharacterized protein n=1 Tax=Podospora australis TaxID=1536484 RepID=A0AAN6WR20_9PEZI|nr:hypothetical protein QBC35DRAFT_534652 [Podospora australis]